jgi:hypothetical protein
MALNFPSPSNQTVYYDPVSGLKYLWNATIGAWETAIQPPAIISTNAPDLNLEGFLWWDSDAVDGGGRLKVYYQGVWIDATPIPDEGANVKIGSSAPTSPVVGDLWWNDEIGRLYIYYLSPDQDSVVGTANWIDASPESRAGDDDKPTVVTSPTAPANGIENDLWFNSTNGNLYIYYIDPDSSNGLWVSIVDYGVASSSGLNSFVGSGAISVTGTLTDPIVSVRDASTTQSGVSRLATQAETTAGTSTSVALTPGMLKNNITSYLPESSETVQGSIQLATSAEVGSGTNTTKAITPKSLNDALPSLGLSVPVGTVIQYAKNIAPSGYLLCNGQLVSRVIYANLLSVIGTTFGGGDGATTFQLPTLSSDNSMLSYCIKV